MLETLIAAAFLVPATASAFYYAAAFLASAWPRTLLRAADCQTTFVVLIPAHNEELSLPTLLLSLQRCDYPKEKLAVYVIADNCSDRTAEVARDHGVNVIKRHQPNLRGKGYGLEYGLNLVLPSQPDAVMILDADSELDSQALRVFDQRLQHGDRVVQGSIRTRNSGDGSGSLVAAVGNVMDDRMACGRDRLGMRVPLRGSNMVFRRDVIEAVPWTCHGLTEDAEYGSLLAKHRIRVRFEPRAKVMSESPVALQDLQQQRRRWRAALNSPLAWLDSKPMVLAQLLLTSMITSIAVIMTRQTWLVIWLATIWLMTIAVYATAILTISKSISISTLLGIPRVVAKLVATTLGRSESTWLRTRRTAEG